MHLWTFTDIIEKGPFCTKLSKLVETSMSAAQLKKHKWKRKARTKERNTMFRSWEVPKLQGFNAFFRPKKVKFKQFQLPTVKVL